MSSHIVPVILARFDSRRLPGKVLKPLLGGKTIIEEILEQVKFIVAQIPIVAPPVVATTDRSVDEPIVCVASAQDATVSIGHLLPLIRLQEIAMVNPEDWLWRLNADSPFILQQLVEWVAEKLPGLDDEVQVITNLVERSFPYGVTLEIFRADMIMGIDAQRAIPEELEHLTPIVRRLPPEGVRSVVADDLGCPSFDSAVRLTIDDAEDAAFFRSLWEDPGFQQTRPGSMERVEYAYQRRLSNAT